MPRIKVEITVYDTRLHLPSGVRGSFFESLALFFRKAIAKYTQFEGKVILDIEYQLTQTDYVDNYLEVHDEK